MTLPLLKVGSGSGGGGGGGVDLLNGLLGWYRNNAMDWSGNANDFSSGSAGLAPGIDGTINAAAELGDAAGQYSDVNSIIPSVFSISIWFFQQESEYIGGTGHIFRVFNSLSQNQQFIGTENPDSNVRWEDSVSGTILDTGVVYPIESEPWWHLVLTYNGTTARLYLNGSLVDEAIASISLLASPEMEWGSTGDLFRSQYLGIWNRAINLAEVQTLYNAGDGFDPTFIAPSDGNQISFLPPPIYYQFPSGS